MKNISDATLQEFFLQALNNPTLQGISIFLAFLIIIYLWKKDPFQIFIYFQERKVKKIAFAKSLLEADNLDKDTNNMIREYLEVYSFEILHKLKVNKPLMKDIIKFQKKYKNKLSLETFRRAYFYLDKSRSKVTINLHWWDHAMRWIISTCSSFLILISIAMFVSAVAFTSQSASISPKFFLLYAYGAGFFITGLLFISANRSYHSAIEIRNCLNESTNNKQD